MQNLQDKLINIGAKLNENKYLGSIKDSFISLMPFTMIGSIAVLWSNVIVNERTGLGAFFKPVMELSFLNPAFNALNFCTLGCISLYIAFFIGTKLGEKLNSNLDKTFCGGIGVASFIVITNTVQTLGDSSVSGIFSASLGSGGLFTAMIASMIGVKLFSVFYGVDALKIKLPDAVPPQISRSFEYLIPAVIVLFIMSICSLTIQTVTGGLFLSDLIMKFVQTPLMKVGGSLPGMLTFQIVILLLWSIGLHGDNMVSGVLSPIVTAMTTANMEAVSNGQAATNIFTSGFNRAFFATGGTGMVIALTIAMMLKAKRDDNKAISRVAFVPNLFNIGEVDMFGYPVVLNTSLIIPFVIAPLVSGTIGYVLTVTGFCPVFAYDVPWTMPPLLIAFIATGGSIKAIITQLIAITVSVLIYLPFVSMHEKAQAKTEEMEKGEQA